MKPPLSETQREELKTVQSAVREAYGAFQKAEEKLEDLNRALADLPLAIRKESATFDDNDQAAVKRLTEMKLRLETLPHRLPLAERAQKAAELSLVQTCNSAAALVDRICTPRVDKLERLISDELGRFWFNGWASQHVRTTDLFRTAVHFKVCHWNTPINNVHTRAAEALAALETLLKDRDPWIKTETVNA